MLEACLWEVMVGEHRVSVFQRVRVFTCTKQQTLSCYKREVNSHVC